MKFSFPPIFRYIWMAMVVVVLAGVRLMNWIDETWISDPVAAKEISLALACLFLLFTILSREKVEDERLKQVRGRAFASAVLLGVLFSTAMAFYPSDSGEPFYNSSGMMLFLQAGFLLDFHVNKHKDK